jgi:hypothetical protein
MLLASPELLLPSASQVPTPTPTGGGPCHRACRIPLASVA